MAEFELSPWDRLELAQEQLRLIAETEEDVDSIDVLKVAHDWTLSPELVGWRTAEVDWKWLIGKLQAWLEVA
jgi:hypothetical protein